MPWDRSPGDRKFGQAELRWKAALERVSNIAVDCSSPGCFGDINRYALPCKQAWLNSQGPPYSYDHFLQWHWIKTVQTVIQQEYVGKLAPAASTLSCTWPSHMGIQVQQGPGADAFGKSPAHLLASGCTSRSGFVFSEQEAAKKQCLRQLYYC